MAKVQYYAAASLDGYISRPDGSIDWLQRYGADAGLGDGPMSDGSYQAFYDEIGALVMGSATYEWILEHAQEWPYDRPTWVFTTRELSQPVGGQVQFASGDAAEVRKAALSAAGRRHVWLVGGGNLASHWASEGLIDEVIVTVVPVFIGEGLPFFAGAVEGELRHISTKTHANGMVELRYSMPH
jgi:dihydrofolate reductase